MERESLDDIINRIDSELLKLSKGESYDFDFPQALSHFRDEIDKHGSNKYLQRKTAKYIGVFNDLCNAIVKEWTCKDLEYDSDRELLKVEEVISEVGRSPETSIKEIPARPETVRLNEERSISFTKYQCLNKSAKDFENDPEGFIQSWGRGLKKCDRFDDFFSGVKAENLTFESYIDDLKRERELTQVDNRDEQPGFDAESLLNDLKGFLSGITSVELYNAIKWHHLTPGEPKGIFRKFHGVYRNAHVFSRYVGMTDEDFNACFEIANGKPLASKHWNPNENKKEHFPEMSKILEKHGFSWK